MKRPARHNYRDRRHVGRGVGVTERAVQKPVSGAGFDACAVGLISQCSTLDAWPHSTAADRPYPPPAWLDKVNLPNRSALPGHFGNATVR
jgi:hypothetical protein